MTRAKGYVAHVRSPRISLVRVALAAALLITGYASNALAAGSISGQITSSVTHTGIAGAKALFFDVNSNGEPITVTADGSGNYSQNLPDGSYAVLTNNAQGFINQIWNNISCSAVCDVNSLTPVVVSGGAVTGINFALVPGGGRIAGTITSSATGNPIAGVLVFFVGLDIDVPFSTAVTDASGHYLSEGGTVSGSVFVITANGQGYQDELYNNHKCTLEGCDIAGDPVSVTLGATTNGIDFALDVGGRISGTVKDINGSPLANIEVRTHDSTGNTVDGVVTDGAGNFITSGLATGTYYVATRNDVGLVDYAWNNLLCVHDFCEAQQGTPISVTVPATTSGINFVLPPGGQTISGTVTAAAGGAPVADAFVALTNASGASVGGAITDNSGHFTTGAVPIGTYYATAFATGYVDQLYDHVSCFGCPPRRTPFVVANQPVTNINFSLLAIGAGTLTGTVTDGFNGSLPTGVQVQLFNASGQSMANVNTSAGVYSFNNISPGSYYVRSNAGASGLFFINQIYNGVTCVNCGITTSGGTLVTVSNGSTTSGINFTLQRGGHITGTITAAATGLALNGIGAQVFNSAGVSVGTFNSNASGVFTSPGLAPGTYYVRTSNTLGYVNQLWQGQTCPQTNCTVTSGTPVVVNAATVSGINFALAAGGQISGKVTDTSNTNLQSVAVQIFSNTGTSLGSVNTDSSGNYTTSGLPAGTYYLRTSSGLLTQSNPPIAVVDQLYNGTQCVPICLNPTTGTPVTVTNSNTTSGINFALTRGGIIAGAVIDANTGVGLGSVAVAIYTATGAFAKSVATDAGGGYTVAGLPPGIYFARTSVGAGAFYLDALYKSGPCSYGCTVTSGTPIAVLSNVASSGVDFALSTGAGGISGTITDRNTGAPVSGVLVEFYTSAGVFTKFTNTTATGTYATSGLAPGTYYARTRQNIPTGHAEQLYNHTNCGSNCVVTNGAPIVVSSAAITTGIDFALGPDTLTKADFDADGKTDIAIWRASTGTWYAINSSNNTVTNQQWGAGGAPFNDVPVPGDYDGDGKTDIAIWRASTGTWYVINSSNNTVTNQQWGAGSAPFNDVAVPGDYDGDGKTDIAVWRASTGTWYVRNSSNNSVTSQVWGAGFAPYNDVAVPADYDGDGKTDIAVWRASTGTWYVLNSSNNSVTSQVWGAGFAPYNDVAVPADYDGDGKTDIAIWRASTGTWYVINSSTSGVTSQAWGAGFAPFNDVAVPGDYDGDGKTDIAVWRASTGTWYVINSSNNTVISQVWGAGFAPYNDVAVPSTGIR